MGEQTKIPWADATCNPWMGCQKVSPACDNCYAERLCTSRLALEWGPHAERRRTAASTWAKVRRWNKTPERLGAPEGTKPFVFGGSLCDVFDNRVDPQWRRDYFDLIRDCPNLLFLLLTKRPQNITRMVELACGDEGFPRNVALGTTVEDRPRLANLTHLQLAAAELNPVFTFGSFEPLLEPLGDIGPWLREEWRCSSCEGRWSASATINRQGHRECPSCTRGGSVSPLQRLPPLGWIICGGESGPKARPVAGSAYRSLRDQARGAGLPFDFKQWGEHIDIPDLRRLPGGGGPGFGAFDHCKHDLATDTVRVGKKAAGDCLDGIIQHERPVVPL